MIRPPRFLRKLLQSKTKKPKSWEFAMKRREQWAVFYALGSTLWLTGLVGLFYYREREKRMEGAPEGLSSARAVARAIGAENATVVRYRGFTKVGEYNLAEEKATYGRLLTESELLELERQNAEEAKERRLS